MQSTRLGQARWLLALGFALSTLALPQAARADDKNDWDWKSESGKDKATSESSDDEGSTWKVKEKDGATWMSKDNDGSVRVYRFRRNLPADDAGGYLGVQVQDVTRALKRAKDLRTDDGALVNNVEDGSPADDAGIQRGDVIVGLNGKPIGDSGDLIGGVRGLDPGDKAKVEIERDGARKTLTVEVGKRPRGMSMMVPNPGNWMGRGNGDTPPMPPPMARQFHGQNLDQLDEQLKDLQEQLQQLRETDLRELREEIQGLREELRRLGTSGDRPRSRDRNDRDDSGD